MKPEDRINQALSSGNADQRRIAQVGLDFVSTLLAKNHDYGGSAWKPPILKPDLSSGAAILVRMSDKVERIGKLATSAAQVEESLVDTVKDLGAYSILWLARPEAEWKGQADGGL